MKNATIRQLRIFDEAARQESFARAAERLHLTPPAVSQQIKELEHAVGATLFDRSGRRIELTTLGEYALLYARRVLNTLTEAENAMARFTGLQSGVLSVGMVSTAMYFVPELLSHFHEEHPGVEVRLTVAANRAEMHALLDDGEIDLAIMGRAPQALRSRSEAFAAHPFVFVSAATHPLLNVGHPPIEALAPYPFLMREQGSGTRNVMQSFFDEHGFTPHQSMTMASNETIKQAVINNLGVSLLSLHTLGLELETGGLRILHVPDTPVMRVWNIVHMPGRTLSPAAEAFRYYVLENAEGLLASRDAKALQG